MSNTPGNTVSIVECPRDAWQGITSFIPTALKTEYIQALVDAGFETIDTGSFVSPAAVPQVSDTHELLRGLNLEESLSKLLVIVANVRGAEQACEEEKVSFVGYPFSISETFQFRNANSSVDESFERVHAIQDICLRKEKQLVIYLSMGFGNPYGDPWAPELVELWIDRLSALGIGFFSVADTVGLADPVTISSLFTALFTRYPTLIAGAHFHSRPDTWRAKIAAAYESGCRRFDSAIAGFGGCPFAQDDLVGNIATENLLHFLNEKNIEPDLHQGAFREANRIFRDKIAPYQALQGASTDRYNG